MHSPFIARAALALLLLSLGLFAAADDATPPAPLDAETMAALGIAPQSGGWSWTSGEYAYDGSGNITAIGATQSFAYDVRGRLTSATLTRPDQPGSRAHSYTYDAFGNMTSRVEETTTIPTPTSSSTNHLTANSAVYDAAGNLTQVQPAGPGFVYEYTWDALGTMKQLRVSNVSGETRQLYIYTADDERIWTYDIGANLSSWKIRGLDGKVLRDFTDDGLWSLSRDYIYRDGQLLAAVTPTQTLYFSLDHLGTPRVVTDAGRVRVGFHHYFPFGQEWLDTSGAQEGEPMKFTGHERDRDGAGAGGANGLDYMHARYYAAVLGRFVSVDPAGFDLSRPQSWNRYTYVSNNPLNGVDPDGREEIEIKPPPPATLAKWTPAQRAEENFKNAYRAEAAAREGLTASEVRGSSSLKNNWVKENGPVPGGKQLDHLIDRQLGGSDLASNGRPTSPSVNMSNGRRTANALRGTTPGTRITGIRFTVLGVLSHVGTLFNLLSYQMVFKEAHGRAPTLGEMSRYLATGDQRTDGQVWVDALKERPSI